LLRLLLVEAGHKPSTKNAQLKQLYYRVITGAKRRGQSSVARHLLVRTYIMLRDGIDYAEFVRRGVPVPSARVGYRPKCLTI